MRLTVGWHAGPHERFAEDVRGPELGSRIRFNGVEDAAEVVACERVDATRPRLTLEVDADALNAARELRRLVGTYLLDLGLVAEELQSRTSGQAAPSGPWRFLATARRFP
jgi:hypothetical protein